MATLYDITRNPDLALEAACRALGDGQAIAIPTETVYGLAADATNPQAITTIYETKGRPRFNPLICHMADLAMAERYGQFDDLARRLAEAFWPGPLTLIVPLTPDSAIHPLATAGLATVGIRVPDGFARQVIAAFNRPLAAPSANTSGKISPTSARHVDEDLGSKINVILDGGPSLVGVESTIIKVDNGVLRLLRPGGLAVEDIERVMGLTVQRDLSHDAAIEAPGMLASHYAPDAAIRLGVLDIAPGEALINFGGQVIANAEKAAAIFDLSPSANLREAAANLFSMMKQADAGAAKSIAVAPIPMVGLGEAINDRLERAAAPRG
jgi:L-threonylcarbamoyladenylate synthase